MSVSQTIQRLRQELGESLLEEGSSCEQRSALVSKDAWRRAVAIAKETLGIGSFLDLCGCDRLARPLRFELVLHARDAGGAVLRIKTLCGEGSPSVDSISEIWPAADWLEREIFEMFGVRFDGREPAARMLTVESFEGHPLRKDFRSEGA